MSAIGFHISQLIVWTTNYNYTNTMGGGGVEGGAKHSMYTGGLWKGVVQQKHFQNHVETNV